MEATLLFVTGILNLCLGGYALYKNPKKLLNISLAFFALGASAWILSLWFTIYFLPILLISKITFISPLVIIASLAIFSYELEPKILYKKPYIQLLILLVPTVFIILVFLNRIVTSVGVSNNHIVNTYGDAYPFYGMLVLTYIFGSLFFLLYKYYRSKDISKSRLKYVLLGLGLMLVPSVATNLILPLVFKTQSLNTLGPASSTFMVVMMTYAILRYHLLEIWFVLRMGTVFSLLFAVISMIYIGLINLLSEFIGGNFSLIFSSFIIVLTFEPLKRLIEEKTDKYFFRRHYRLEDIITESNSIAHKLELNINKISRTFAEIIQRYFKVSATGIAILTPRDSFILTKVWDSQIQTLELPPDNQIVSFLKANPDFIINYYDLSDMFEAGKVVLDVEDIDLLPSVYEDMVVFGFVLAIPIKFEGDLVGIHFIGEKRSGDRFTAQDLKILDHLTNEAGGLINNARLYEDLKKLDEAKSNFISVVSHQLRTPLSAMRWSTELLLGGGVDSKSRREFLEDNYKNSIFMIYHLDDMLTALDIEDKEIKLKKTTCSLRDLAEEVLNDNRKLIRENKLKVKIDFPKRAEKLECDQKKLKKILEVLISNALKYSLGPGGTIAIASKEKPVNGDKFVEISISDNGIGVAPEEERYIFEKFYRGERAKKMSPNGFGLGLFIVRAFVEAHGGEIYFESSGSGQGSRFYFTIPKK